jgi:hypothetical protein
MYQKVIDFLYRSPRSKIRTINRFGGFFNYYSVIRNQKRMEERSLTLPPLELSLNGLPIFFLTGKKYLYQTLFCIHSLVKSTAEDFSVYLVDDGSFDEELISRVQRQLPGAVIIGADTIENNLAEKLPFERYPVIRNKRVVYPHLKKLTDVHTIDVDIPFKVVLDSDMLFWNKPEQFISWLKSPDKPIYMLDSERSYGYSLDTMGSLCGQKVPDLVNVGLIGIQSKTIDWNALESWITELEASGGTSYYLEQALSAMIINKQQSVILPRSEYIVNPSPRDIDQNKGVLHHYVDLSKEGYFKKSWKKIAN